MLTITALRAIGESLSFFKRIATSVAAIVLRTVIVSREFAGGLRACTFVDDLRERVRFRRRLNVNRSLPSCI